MRPLPLRALPLGALLVLVPAATAQVTTREGVSSAGAQSNEWSMEASISADGRFLAFTSWASNLVAGDTNGMVDVFVRDRLTGTTGRVSVSGGGTQAGSHSDWPSISADGRSVAFRSDASDLVAGDVNGVSDVFVRDRLTGTTVLASVSSGGAQGDAGSDHPSLSADGRWLAFRSAASNLVTGDTNGAVDVFVRDLRSGTTERVSISGGGAQANSHNAWPSISADGRFVAFQGGGSNLVAGDTNAISDIFVRDRLLGTTERVSVSSAGVQANGTSAWPAISADGRHVAFVSAAFGLVAGDTNGSWDVFVRDRLAGTTERASVSGTGAQGNLHSGWPAISADGRHVAFESGASDLVAGDVNATSDVFVRDRVAGTTERTSVSSGGAGGDSASYRPSISADARFVGYHSFASNLVPGDTNVTWDVFVRDRDAAGLASVCEPGAGGVMACPCSNPPAVAGPGCDNSAATGGASLAASGSAYLSTDSLVFTTGGQTPASTSIVLQGDAEVAGGLGFGQGVRCAGGALKRLYVKVAAGGSVTAPDAGAGDPGVSTRSAALGDTIGAGESRWYLVYYRDPVVLGGCPATSTFNATPTGRVSWWP